MNNEISILTHGLRQKQNDVITSLHNGKEIPAYRPGEQISSRASLPRTEDRENTHGGKPKTNKNCDSLSPVRLSDESTGKL